MVWAKPRWRPPEQPLISVLSAEQGFGCKGQELGKLVTVAVGTCPCTVVCPTGGWPLSMATGNWPGC